MIYLVRHGLDDENYIGGYSYGGLVKEGINQVEQLALWLSNNDFSIDRIYSSDIYRAVETTLIINKYLNLDITYDQNLREQNKGLLNGMLRSEALFKYSDILLSEDVNLKYPEGESVYDLYIRIKKLLLDISNYDNSLLVTHRGVINMFYYLLNNDTLDMDKSKYGVTHASLHELDLTKGKIRRLK